MTVKNQRTAYFSLRGFTTHAMQKHHKTSGVTGPTFTKFVAVVFFIDGVNATILVAIRPPIVE